MFKNCSYCINVLCAVVLFVGNAFLFHGAYFKESCRRASSDRLLPPTCWCRVVLSCLSHIPDPVPPGYLVFRLLVWASLILVGYLVLPLILIGSFLVLAPLVLVWSLVVPVLASQVVVA